MPPARVDEPVLNLIVGQACLQHQLVLLVIVREWVRCMLHEPSSQDGHGSFRQVPLALGLSVLFRALAVAIAGLDLSGVGVGSGGGDGGGGDAAAAAAACVVDIDVAVGVAAVQNS